MEFVFIFKKKTQVNYIKRLKTHTYQTKQNKAVRYIIFSVNIWCSLLLCEGGYCNTSLTLSLDIDHWLTHAALCWCKPVNMRFISSNQTLNSVKEFKLLATLLLDRKFHDEKWLHVNWEGSMFPEPCQHAGVNKGSNHRHEAQLV